MLRVLTLNLWNLERWRDRRDEILAWLSRLDPDVVCLQEVVDSDGRNQARWLAERSGTPHVAYGASGSVAAGTTFGNAVLSRWAIEDRQAVPLPSAPLLPGDVTRAVTHARTRGLDVFSTHLSSPFGAVELRRAQAVRLVEVVQDRADPNSPLPPVVAGDFNAEPDSDEIRFLCGLTVLDGRHAYFQDAWRVVGGPGPGWTWDNRNPFAALEHEPDRRIDYVLVGWRRADGAGRVEAVRVVCDRALSGTYASDHYGVLAEIAET